MEAKTAYSSLSDLILKGFLTVDVDLRGTHLILKTVNEKEYDLIKLYSGDPQKKDYQLRLNIYFLVFSLFMLNNQNILCDRQKNISEMYDYFFNLPNILIKKILSSLNPLRAAMYDCLKFLEGYSYTNLSRSLWKALNGNMPCNTEFTGIPGTSELGLNVHQESWIIINRSLDDEDIYNKDFSLALMGASASNPQGARHIRNQFDSSKKMTEDRRTKLAKVGFIDTTQWSPDGWAASVETTEELVAELERQMTGVKDKHDIFMENYMNKVREQAERKTREAQERIKRFQDGHDNVFIDGEQRILTPEETRNLKQKKPVRVIDIVEDQVSPEDKSKFLSKIGARVLTSK